VIRQLRPFYSPEDLAQVYGTQYDHTRWPDHIERVEHTAALLKSMDPESVADLSCGDGAVVRKAEVPGPVYLGDYQGDYLYSGPIEKTIEQIPAVDVFVLSETLEHVEDPAGLLSAIRNKADRLLLSTPCGEWDDQNPQHYWGWDTDGVLSLLWEAGWNVTDQELYTPSSVAYYTFQIWRCE
jgi:hypothetical protein